MHTIGKCMSVMMVALWVSGEPKINRQYHVIQSICHLPCCYISWFNLGCFSSLTNGRNNSFMWLFKENQEITCSYFDYLFTFVTMNLTLKITNIVGELLFISKGTSFLEIIKSIDVISKVSRYKTYHCPIWSPISGGVYESPFRGVQLFSPEKNRV